MDHNTELQNTAGSEQTSVCTAPDAGLLDGEVLSPKNKFSFRKMMNRFNKRRYSYLFYAFLIPVVLNYIIYLSMGLHPFGNGSVLVLDLNGQYVYFYEALRNAVYGETSMIYTFCRSLGGEFMGMYAYYVASPFSYIVCLFPQDRILEALLTIFLLKAGISGMTMAYYLDRISTRLNKVNVVIFSVLYSMSAYAVVQQHNSMWIDALMWLPLLTLGIESLVREGKYRLYVVMLALTLLSNYYIGYMACIYTFLYFFYYYFSRNEKNPEGTAMRNNPTGERNHFLRSLFRIGFFSVIAVGISLVVVYPAYTSLQFGKNAFSNPNFSFSLRFELLDFFTRFLPGAYDTVRPEGLPFVYCGVLTLYCVPVYFFSKKFSVREKVFAFTLLAVFFLSFSVNTIDMVWHGFQKPNWLNYRYSFMMSFLLVSLGYRGFGELQKVSGKVIAAICGAGVLLVAVCQKFDYHSYVDRISGTVEFDQPLEELNVIWLSLLCFVVFAILLCALIKGRDKAGISVIICIFVCVEAYANGIAVDSEFGEDVIYSTYSSYNSFISAIRPLSDDILESDAGFYRFEKNAHRKYCDNMALNIRGITNSTSTLNRKTIDFIAQLGYAGKSHWTKYLGGNLLNDSLIGIKYVIAAEKDGLEEPYEKTDCEPGTYNSVDYYVYKNPYALSLAYAVDEAVASFNVKDDSPVLRLNRMVSAMLGEAEDLALFVPLEYDITTANCTTSTIAGHVKYTHLVENSEATVVYSFTVQKDGEVYFYLPSDYPRIVNLRVNGSAKGNFYDSETSRIVSLGSYAAGDELSLSMALDANELYVKQDVPALFQMDKEAVKDALVRLAEEQVIIDEGWTPTHLTGTVTTKEDRRLIQTTLGLDSGWQVYVDGVRTETTELYGALIGFYIETAGEHTVELRYRPTCLTVGAAVTAASVVLFVLVILFEKKLRLLLSRVTAQGNDDEEVPDDCFDTEELPDDWDVNVYRLDDILPPTHPDGDPTEEPAGTVPDQPAAAPADEAEKTPAEPSPDDSEPATTAKNQEDNSDGE